MPFQTRFLVAFTVVATVLFSTAGQQHALAQFGDDLGLGTVNDEPCDPVPAIAEDDAEPQPALVYIDPAQFVPEALSRPIDLDVTDVTLAEAMQRISEATGLPVRIDEEELQNEGVNADEVVSDRAENEPAYLLLDRLLDNVGGIELAWYVDHGLLQITTKLDADDYMLTVTYNVRDLLEAGYSKHDVILVLLNTTSGLWFDLDGVGGTMQFFGEMLAVRQTPRVHRQVAALLHAIRAKGRERRVLEPPTHLELEQQLDQVAAVELSETPLNEFVETFRQEYGLQVRVDHEELGNEGIGESDIVSLPTSELPIRSVLHLTLKDVAGVELAAIVHRGEIWVTTKIVADDIMLPVVYDVGDLTLQSTCRMASLHDTILNQTSGPWFDLDGVGGTIETAGDLLVIRQTQRVHAEVRTLLADLRAGIDESSDNGWEDCFPIELETHYYRVDTDVADELISRIPQLVAPGTWASTVNQQGETVQLEPDGVGTIDRMVGGRRLIGLQAAPSTNDDENAKRSDSAQKQTATPVVIPRRVLIIQHCITVHEQLSTLMNKIDPPSSNESNDSDFGPGFSGESRTRKFHGGGFGSVLE